MVRSLATTGAAAFCLLVGACSSTLPDTHFLSSRYAVNAAWIENTLGPLRPGGALRS